MTRLDWVRDADVSEFVAYFKELVFDPRAVFNQSYKPVRGPLFRISHFKGAYTEYFWNGLNLAEANSILSVYKDHFELAVEDPFQTLVTASRVLVWGGVTVESTISWLLDLSEKKTLGETLRKGARILSGEDDQPLEEFRDPSCLLSDSASTKLYSVLGPSTIIYDNRVGAALARIVLAWLETTRPDAEMVPEMLSFMRGAKKRNPSTKRFAFPPKETGYKHALSNLRANWLVKELSADARFDETFPDTAGRSESEKMRAIEAALFMIGADINTISIVYPPA